LDCRATLPVYTPSRARVYRWVKWPAMLVATGLAFGSTVFTWWGAFAICISGFVWMERVRHSIRRKLPAAQWPKELFL
jgi:hypothetical protein